jgi:hypothetical protein
MVNRLWPKLPGFDSLQVQVFFCSLPLWGPRCTGAVSQEVKRPVHETDHRPLPSSEVKHAWRCAYTYPTSIYGVVLCLKGRQVRILDDKLWFLSPSKPIVSSQGFHISSDSLQFQSGYVREVIIVTPFFNSYLLKKLIVFFVSKRGGLCKPY